MEANEYLILASIQQNRGFLRRNIAHCFSEAVRDAWHEIEDGLKDPRNWTAENEGRLRALAVEVRAALE